MAKKTQVSDIDRGIYDIINEERHEYRSDKGLSEDIIRDISKEKNEPEWMLEKRLKKTLITTPKKNILGNQ